MGTKYWVSADAHFGHHMILEYCRRPFHSVEHMDREMIRRWNERVSDGDTVYYLGDFCFRYTMIDGEGNEVLLRGSEVYVPQLNGNIVFLKGNHDRRTDSGIMTSATINYGGVDWHLSHEPKHRYRYNMCGHVHTDWKFKMGGNYVIVNVGVDQWGYAPVSIDTIIGELPDRFKIGKR